MRIPSIPVYPNLLRSGSPVLLSESYAATFGRSEGIVYDCGNEKAQVAYHADYRPALIPLVELRLNLATDTGMCHAARWLADRVGWKMRWIATAPSWERVMTDKGPEWVLRYGNNALYATDVPGISDMADPAEALAAACVAVGGAR